MAVTADNMLDLFSEDGSDSRHQYLTFRLAEESYAVGILAVKEILECGAMTAVPMMPDYVLGVINLRGRVVPVIDLAQRFSGRRTVAGRRTCIVIVEVGPEDSRQDMGIIVDAVSQVVDIPPAQVEPAPSLGAKLRAEFIAGMGKLDGGFIILLDIERVLSVAELDELRS